MRQYRIFPQPVRMEGNDCAGNQLIIRLYVLRQNQRIGWNLRFHTSAQHGIELKTGQFDHGIGKEQHPQDIAKQDKRNKSEYPIYNLRLNSPLFLCPHVTIPTIISILSVFRLESKILLKKPSEDGFVNVINYGALKSHRVRDGL